MLVTQKKNKNVADYQNVGPKLTQTVTIVTFQFVASVRLVAECQQTQDFFIYFFLTKDPQPNIDRVYICLLHISHAQTPFKSEKKKKSFKRKMLIQTKKERKKEKK